MSPLPILLLSVEQGPKAGCRLECNAAAISTVGRARSNTLQISRDTGISQKHLRFQWSGAGDKDDDDAHAGWIAIDAGSSNGTIINGVLIEPHKAFLLHTGDLIKIGSETTMKVEILGLALEVMATPKAKKSSKRTATCIASESHAKGTPVVSRRHARKAGCAACKVLPVQEYEDKRLDAMEDEVYPSKHQIHDVVKGYSKQKHGSKNELFHGKQVCIIAEGHGEQQDEAAETVVSWDDHPDDTVEGNGKKGGNISTARKRCRGRGQGKLGTNNEVEEDQGKQSCRARAPDKHAVNNVAKGKQENNAKASRDHVKIAASSAADIDLGMTVEQWFHHMMEEGPKYLYKVSESIVQDVMLESKQFDEYVLSLM